MSYSLGDGSQRPRILSVQTSGSIDLAAHALQDGNLVVLPTDTVYGLAAAYQHPAAIARIYEVKRRPPDRPIALLVDRIEDVERVTEGISASALALMMRFWPGGLTIVLPRRVDVPDIVTAGGPTVAIRMPDHWVPRALARLLDAPLPTTSANRSGQPSPTDALQARNQLNGDVAIYLDDGPARIGVDSTVVDLSTSPPTVLRVGAISIEAIQSAIGPVATGPT
jgi:L-threonylcarbamoyladenylate synthase